MAMSTENKLYVAVGLLAVLGGAFFFQRKEAQKVAAVHTVEARTAQLPDIKLKDDDSDKIDKISIARPAKKKDAKDGAAEDAPDTKAEAPPPVTLSKKEGKWLVTEPVNATANETNVNSLLTNLKALEVAEQIDASNEGLEKYDLTDDQAIHVTFYQGDQPFREFWFGKGGGRGQMARIKGKDGVFAIKGFSKYSYEREAKDWRDKSIFKFESDKVKAVSLSNEHGVFEFQKDGSSWKGTFQKPKAAKGTEIKDFESSKVNDLLNAYKSLNADNFGDGKTPADVGLTTPVATLLITLDDGGRREVKYGSNAEGSSRWIQTNQGDTIYSVTSWAGDWGTAEIKKFQKAAKDPAKDDKPNVTPADIAGSSLPMGDDEGDDEH